MPARQNVRSWHDDPLPVPGPQVPATRIGYRGSARRRLAAVRPLPTGRARLAIDDVARRPFPRGSTAFRRAAMLRHGAAARVLASAVCRVAPCPGDVDRGAWCPW